MSVSISPIITIPVPMEAPGLHSTPSGDEFQQVLHSAIQQVEASHGAADSAVQGFLSGENQELHSTILATQKAELDFELFLQIRNKVVSAYQEVMRMQV
jgi:flagellar hook-basal body complex protein FliE